MTKIKEVFFGDRLWYTYDNKSGFWVSQRPTDPQSATITGEELNYLLKDNIKYGYNLLDKLQKQIANLKQLSAQLEEEE